MEIYISEEDLLQNIQDKFQEAYPHLRLEFFKHPHEAGEGCPRNERWPLNTPIEDIRMVHSFGWIDISEDRTVAELEKDFYRQIGLSVQVLRKSGLNWLLTTRTDHLTLKIQDEMGAGVL
ncbi:hypothetical protein [Chitinophaga sp.]|uniref:hypothetical protein n=1 Tax=Chitinophaga sp. TaxID=1869181 RepID=UPI0031DBF94F